MLAKVVASTLTGRPARLVDFMATAPIIALYADRYRYDAAPCFAGVSEIGIYECDSGFRFFYPLSTSGPESLYCALEKFDWNYKESKWEHDRALRFVRAGHKVAVC